VLAWYLVFSKPQRERIALENLERQNYQVYLPMVRNRRRVGGRYRSLIEPMFPRYLFIHLDDQNEDWGPIRSTIGVANLVRFGVIPARLPDTLVQLMREREDAQGLQNLPVQELQAGDRVRIVEGVVAGYEALYQSSTSNERVILLLEIAERSAQITLRQDDVEVVAKNESRS